MHDIRPREIIAPEANATSVTAKKTKRRVIVEGQESLGSMGVAEIEDQIFALQETMK